VNQDIEIKTIHFRPKLSCLENQFVSDNFTEFKVNIFDNDMNYYLMTVSK